ncbi:hypothetical protein ASPFODRAFT_484560 [Aspergillus luchuensis CBS 106.47]|uniref:Uncharacterized protein n=1 Tax=Aspergillus luchuensis (strain CBS 106.47) TaxID=1137211 RepID=A0A1M3TQQ7_ASPLC|nr:hypothetical protein ASPFODRAFT_484560 [Aspergillus luchuensis CBS 106.47]
MRFFTTCWIIVSRLLLVLISFFFSFLLGAAWASRISLVMGAYFLRRRGGTPVRLAAALARKGSSMALHSRYCLFFFFLFLFFLFLFVGFPSSSARFDNRDHWRITVLIMVGIQWNGLCWGCWGIPFEPAKFQPATTDLGHLRGTWIGSRACDKIVLSVHNSCTVLHITYTVLVLCLHMLSLRVLSFPPSKVET